VVIGDAGGKRDGGIWELSPQKILETTAFTLA